MKINHQNGVLERKQRTVESRERSSGDGRWSRVLRIARQSLEKPGATGLAMLLTAPSLTVGLYADDYLQQLMLREPPNFGPLKRNPLDLFTFVDGQPNYRRALMDEGVLGWETHPEIKIAFLRPLSSLTHLLDQILWPNSAIWAHAHSILWFGILLAVLAVLYRRFHAGGWIAGFALLLFAIDDAHGAAIGFVANRNIFIAATFSILALLVHDRWIRDRWRHGSWLGPLLFAIALLAGESAISLLAFLGGHALFLDSGRWHRRVLNLVGYLAVLLVWRIVYSALGYGALHSGFYVDPVSNPLEFVFAVASRAPFLLLGQLAAPSATFSVLYPTGVAIAIGAIAVLAVLWITWLLWPTLRSNPVARFWGVGTLLAVIPICAVFPCDRLLVYVGIGAMPLAALFIKQHREREFPEGRLRLWSSRLGFVSLIFFHMLLAPLALPLTSMSLRNLAAMEAKTDPAIPTSPSITQSTVVVVSTPGAPFQNLLPFRRELHGIPRPKALRVLSMGPTALKFERLDARTVRLHAASGFLPSTLERMLRDLGDRFAPGERIEVAGMTTVVETIMDDGRPEKLRFSFEKNLDDPSYLWLSWQGNEMGSFTLPAVGETLTLPAPLLLPAF